MTDKYEALKEAAIEVSIEITRINKAMGETVFNPAATEMLRDALKEAAIEGED